jgi:hypothetical protein
MGLFSHPAMQFYLSSSEQIKQHYAAAMSGPANNLSMFSIDNILAPRSHLFPQNAAAMSLYQPEQALHGFNPNINPTTSVGSVSSQMHSTEIMQGMWVLLTLTSCCGCG